MYTTSIKPLSSLERRLRFKLSEDEINARFERNAEEIAKEARLPGFRPGKVPRILIKERYRDNILREVHSRGVRDAMEHAENLADCDVWKITHVDVDKPNELNETEYIVDFVEKPVLDLTQLESLNLCVPKITTDEDFLKRGGSLYRFERAIGSEIERPIQIGDRVVVEVEDVASEFSGDIRGTYAEWVQEYLGRHQIVLERSLYDDDQLGSLLHEELLNRSVGEEFTVDTAISTVPLQSLQPENDEALQASTSDVVKDVEETVIDDSTDDNEQTETSEEVSIFAWLDSSRLPLRRLSAKVKILKVEEISETAVNEEFFAREDVPYKNLQELDAELEQYVEGSIQQGSRDARRAQVTAQISALNPIDLPYRVLVGEHNVSAVDANWSELGATFVPDSNGLQPSLLTKTYYGIVESLFIKQYAEENSLEPTDDLIAEHTRVEYERLSKLGLDSDRVFTPEFQNLVRSDVMRTRVMTDIFERYKAPEVNVSFFDFYYLSRSGLWSLPPDGGPFSWTSPVSSDEILETLEAESRVSKSNDATEYVEEHAASNVPETAGMLEEQDGEKSQGNVFTNWFKNKFKRTSATKPNENDQT